MNVEIKKKSVNIIKTAETSLNLTWDSMQIVGQYMNYFTKKKSHREKDVKQKKSNVLICTTGDTGSAAIEALKGEL